MSEARDGLLARALEYYAEHGVHDTSLRTLAREIGTSQRMLHYHFGSRHDVLAAVIDAVAGSQAEQIGLLFDAQDPLTAARQNWAETASGAQRYGALWFELATHAMRARPYAHGLREVMVDAQLREFTRVFSRHTDVEHATRLARLTLAVGQGLLFGLLIDGDRAGADDAVETCTTLVADALGLQHP